MKVFERAILAAIAAAFRCVTERDQNPMGAWVRDYDAKNWFPKVGRPKEEKRNAAKEG